MIENYLFTVTYCLSHNEHKRGGRPCLTANNFDVNFFWMWSILGTWFLKNSFSFLATSYSSPLKNPMVTFLFTYSLWSNFWPRTVKLAKPVPGLPCCPFPPFWSGQSSIVPHYSFLPGVSLILLLCPRHCHPLFDTWLIIYSITFLSNVSFTSQLQWRFRMAGIYQST